MVIEVYLNGVLLQDEPEGVDKITEIIENDDSLHGYVVKYNQITLTFYGDGYLFIKNLVRLNGYENRIDVQITIKDSGGYTDSIGAYFFTTDIDFNTKENTFEVQLEDKNFGAFLKSGSKEKIAISTAVSRNGVAMPGMYSLSSITMFTPSTGAALPTDAKVLDIRTVMRILISYLSDLGLDFKFDATLPNSYGLTKHYFIQTRGTDPDNQVSFQEMMEFLWKAFGLKFWIDTSLQIPEFKINFETTLMEASGDVTFDDVDDMSVTFDQDKMYSTVAMGSTKEIIDRGAVIYTLPYAPLVGFGTENVNARSVAMIDNKLDLTLDNFICGTNKIEELLSSTSYDETNLIVQYSGSAASQGTYGIVGTSLYNEDLLNLRVLQNHQLPITMVSELGVDTDGFKYYLSSDVAVPSSVFPVLFNQLVPDGYNHSSNYNAATGEYTIPNNGVYRFRVSIWLDIISLTEYFGLSNGVLTVIDVYRNGGPISSQSIELNGTGLNRHYTYEFEGIYDAGDTISIGITQSFLYSTGTGTNSANLRGYYIYTDANGNSINAGTGFETVFTFNGGGAAVVPNTQDYPALNYDFKYGIDLNSWKKLRSRPIQGVSVNTNGNNSTKTWIKKISRSWISGESDVTLFTKLSENNIL